MSSSAIIVAATAIGALLSLCDASAFLQAHTPTESEEAARERIVRGLLAELSHHDDVAKLKALEEELRPFFAALPKDEHGKLESPTVRYALHRYFAQWRGWHMKGLEHGASELNTTAVDVVEIFAQGQGTDLSRLALFVSKLTDLVHKEAHVNLRNVYLALNISTIGRASTTLVELALHRYLVMYLLGDSTERITDETMIEAERDLVDVYPAWRSVKLWSKDLDQTLRFTERSRRNPFFGNDTLFEDSLATVQELGHRFASFQNLECRSLKDAMTEIEYKGTGRVLLSDFYRVGLQEGYWQFNEKLEYLRSLGALDESDPKRLSVFIPNYIHSPSNCLSASGFYSVCCFNECEGLLGNLERSIMAPSASPIRIVELASKLESDTVAAPRTISSVLQARLSAIARLHGGLVPLHGRLFSQWMHHAYPRECPFPHVSGSIKPLAQEEWQERMGGQDPVATKEEMILLSTGQAVVEEEESASLPWTEMEELVAPSQKLRMTSCFTPWRWALILVVLASVAMPLVRLAKVSDGCAPEGKNHRHLV